MQKQSHIFLKRLSWTLQILLCFASRRYVVLQKKAAFLTKKSPSNQTSTFGGGCGCGCRGCGGGSCGLVIAWAAKKASLKWNQGFWNCSGVESFFYDSLSCSHLQEDLLVDDCKVFVVMVVKKNFHLQEGLHTLWWWWLEQLWWWWSRHCWNNQGAHLKNDHNNLHALLLCRW